MGLQHHGKYLVSCCWLDVPFPLATWGNEGESGIHNTPEGKCNVVSWFDENSNQMWIFGGAVSQLLNTSNDLWRWEFTGMNTFDPPNFLTMTVSSPGTTTTRFIL